MNIQELREHLQQLAARDEGAWEAELERRKLDEIAHSNVVHSHEARSKKDHEDYGKRFGNLKYYRGAAKINKYFFDWIDQNAKEKVVFDLACGNGPLTLRAARAGATLAIGMDLSPQCIHNAKEAALQEGISSSQVVFLRGDGEHTGLPDSSIDTVICSGVLHHVDLSYVFPELRRILKPGGKLIAVEPLDYNLLIRLYRRLTPHIRTAWEAEHILKVEDITFAKRFFHMRELRFWCFSSPLCAFCPPLLPILNGLDALLTRIPLIRLWSWQFSMELVSRK